ncbi:MAG: glycosyltransferase family 9 protein [Candidatus Omnitrophota bacterium]|nr:glycosyltransferase family 9 protein [Candidatus Omnitrophota bacterium]MBU1928489.1 glycosyltransferase family 9 protein [Candidatus Omnitrophota bacterium]MBU2035438.1 glycosyltransferase family 9 protein [Candidatus Omnitrophota bacterium]MBU2221320.1 glycosyltransferase family 9 protein [Candidatus Omnitrophota bacterium]MBU2257953.1 glycosyltransferase family 9 protein [Candidatus Omnitrophota bacterium]
MKKILLNLYFWLRLIFILFSRILFPSRVSLPKRLSRFLIIRIDRMGDFVVSIPVIENIRLEYPDAIIDVLVRPYLKELAGLVKSVNKVIIYDNLISTARRLKREKYDAVFDLLYDYKIRPAILAYLCGAPIRLGFSWGFRELFLNRVVNPINHPYDDMGRLQLRLLDLLGIPKKEIIPKLILDSDDAPEGIFIAMHPGGFYDSQRWSKDKFVLLAKKILASYRVKLKIVGASNDEKIVNYIVQGINNPNAESLMSGLKEFAIFLKGCSLLICNNSGPMHLAAALGVPTISIMGPADPILWWPKGINQKVIRKDLLCSPCSKGSCWDHKCMELVNVEEVFEKVKSVMGKLGIRAIDQR